MELDGANQLSKSPPSSSVFVHEGIEIHRKFRGKCVAQLQNEIHSLFAYEPKIIP